MNERKLWRIMDGARKTREYPIYGVRLDEVLLVRRIIGSSLVKFFTLLNKATQ